MNNVYGRGTKDYYLSRRLLQELEKILDYPLTVIEAPSGAGKTTAVREYLKEYIPQSVNEYWYTAIGETPARVWEYIYDAFYPFDSETAEALKYLGTPARETLGDIARLLKSCRCEAPTVLVIDNYQLIQSDIQREIISALSYNGSSNLHIVIITQELDLPAPGSTYNSRILTIGKDTLFFTAREAENYFRHIGLRISEEELKNVMVSTEGWIAALCLQVIHYRTTGNFDNAAKITLLVKTAIWDHLSDDEKYFLLAASLLDSFTMSQACILLDVTEIAVYAKTLLERSSFIRYHKNTGQYIIHSLLNDFLQYEFENLSEQAKKQLWQRAGKACAQQGQNFKAANFFALTEDFEALLSLPIKGNDLTGHIEADLSSFFTSVLGSCPMETLRRYPIRLLVFAFHLFLVGDYSGFDRLCNIIGGLLQSPATSGFELEELKRIQGEFCLVMSFTKFNNIEKMSEGHKTAWALLGGPTTLFNWEDSWTFRQPSVMYLFWSKSGELSHTLDLMNECMPIYTKLTMGHGMAAEYAMRAEALLMAGDDTAAEPLCHKALFLACAKKQNSICYAAELILARIALLRGNIEDYKAVLDSMENRIYAGIKYDGRATAELCKAFLDTTLGNINELASWIFAPDNMWQKLFKVAIPYGQMIYVKTLLLEGKNAAVLGISDALLLVVEELHFVLPQVYLLIYTAIAQNRQGGRERALENLCQALSLALPDKVYLPFAEQEELLPLLKQAGQIIGNKAAMDEVLTLCRRQANGMKAVKDALVLTPRLTARECDTALLAQKGLNNKEIAEMMFVSEATVKFHLKSIYKKLGIRSRVQLNDYNLKR